MTHPAHPQPYAAAAAPRPQPPRGGARRALAAWGRVLIALVLVALALLGGLWWWAGTGTSLATALQQAARYLPEGQQLESRDVTGSLRAGGHIGWLRWSSPTLAVEAHDARIAWSLAPLLHRQLRLGEVHAAQVLITPQAGPAPQQDTPTQPLQQLVLPLRIDLPFAVDRITWAAASPVTIDGLTGSYRYDGDRHRLAVDQVSLAQGRYSVQATLQGAEPMALSATLNGTLHTPVPGSAQPLQAHAHASVQGTLATADARLQLTGRITRQPASADAGAEKPTPNLSAPQTDPGTDLHVDLQARIAPWARQPLLQAAADLQGLDLATLWPQAPATLLSGQARLEPAPGGEAGSETGWRIQAALTNTLPGPWNRQRLPIAALQAQARFDGQQWTLPQATLQAGGGSIALQGAYTPATQALQGQATVQAVNPAALHTQLAAAPVSGTASAESRPGAGASAVHFAADLRAAASLSARTPRTAAGTATKAPATTAPAASTPATHAGAPLRLDHLAVQGQWQDGRIDITRLQIDALQAQVSAQALRIDTAGPALQGRLQATLPGATAQLDGQVAPASGQGTLQLRLADALRTQRWLQGLARLPGLAGMSAALARWSLDGNAALQAQWRGGWQDLQRQLQTAGLAPGTATPAQGAGRFELAAQLSAPRLQITQIAQTPPRKNDANAQEKSAPTANGALTLALQDTTVQLRGSLAQATLEWDGALRYGAAPAHQAQLQLRARAGSQGAGRWQAQVDALQAQAQPVGRPGPWTLRLTQPLALRLQQSPQPPQSKQSPQTVLEAEAGQITVSGPRPGDMRLRWQPLRYAQSPQGAAQLRSQGELLGLPLDWANAWQTDGQDALARLGLAGNLVLDGSWDIDTGDRLRAQASLRRSSGDLRMLIGNAAPATAVHSSGQGTQAAKAVTNAATGTADAAGSAAGLRQAAITITADGDSLRARLDWDSERAGRVQAEGSTRLSRAGGADSGWAWPDDAPLAATVRANLPDVGVWSALAPPGWRVRGTLNADARLTGTRAAPLWSGQLAADQFAVRSVLDGVDLQGGRLRATLQGEQLTITELRVHGGQGSRARIAGFSGNRTAAPQDGGLLTGNGTITWGAAAGAGGAGGSGIAMDLRARAQALQVLARADRQLSVSGDLTARLQGGQLTLRGQLTTDRATIILPEAGAPTLGSDVVVRSAALDRQAAAQAARDAQKAGQNQAVGQVQAARPPDIAITLDLGDDFALQGHGITTRLAGQLDIRSNAATGAAPRVTGEVRTVQGRYRAWGQALDVESGLLRFNGPYDNPALDVLAIRPNISVRAGVQVTGTAQRPRVRLWADPDLPDAEKLSWVVLGRSGAGGGAEAALLQQAALTLLGRSTGGGADGITSGIARGLGLDEIGFKGPGAGEDASAAALTLGKRLSKDLYVSYERSLAGVLGTLYIFYDLSRNLTLRGQTGMQSAVDLIYTVRYD